MAWEPDYTTLGDLAEFVRIPAGDVVDDAQMMLAITAASRAVDRTAGRQFGMVAAAEARVYTARCDPARLRWSVPIDDLMDATGLTVAYDSAGDETYASAITAYSLRPGNAAPRARPWTELIVRPTSTVQPTGLEAGVRVTGLWGWSAVPAPVEEATLLQASRLLSRRDSPYGIAGSPETGSEMRLLAKVDPDVAVSLAGYLRGARWRFS